VAVGQRRRLASRPERLELESSIGAARNRDNPRHLSNRADRHAGLVGPFDGARRQRRIGGAPVCFSTPLPRAGRDITAQRPGCVFVCHDRPSSPPGGSMRSTFPAAAIAACVALLCPSQRAAAAGSPEDDVAATVEAVLDKSFAVDWQGIEALKSIDWAPLPPKTLRDCLPDGGCFARQGTAHLGGRPLAVLASGARGFVSHIYLRNPGAPFGEAAVLSALRQAGLATTLARCPVAGSAGPGSGGTHWYRVASARTNPGYVSIQTSCNGTPCEGFAVSPGDELPPLQPDQLRLYSEQCQAGGQGQPRQPVATARPHEQLSQLLVALLPRAGAAAPYDWQALADQAAGVRWQAGGAKKGDLSYKGDPNPWMHSGVAVFGGRRFDVLASGSPTQVKTVYLEEGGLHPRGEDLLGLLRSQGHAVELVRCGPLYTESTNNWYRVSGAATRPVMLRQSLRLDGRQVQDSYELRLDASLPRRDARDRDPGIGGCKA
jgi:hypothetical protein